VLWELWGKKGKLYLDRNGDTKNETGKNGLGKKTSLRPKKGKAPYRGGRVLAADWGE